MRMREIHDDASGWRLECANRVHLRQLPVHALENDRPVFARGRPTEHRLCFYAMQLIQGRGLDRIIGETAAGKSAGTNNLDATWPDGRPPVARSETPTALSGLAPREFCRAIAHIGARVADALAFQHDRLQVPSDLETIVLKAAARDPAQRYPTAGEMAEHLGRFLDDRPILAKRAGRMERTWRWCRRNPALAGTTVAAFLLMVAVTVVSVVGYARTAAANCETAAALAAEKAQREQAECTATLALEALNRTYERYRRAVELQGKLVKQYPEVAAYRCWLSLMERSLGRVLGQRGQWKEARSVLESAAGRLEALGKKDPRLGTVRPLLGTVYQDLAAVLIGGGETALAAEVRGKAEECKLEGGPFRPHDRPSHRVPPGAP